MSRNTIFFLLVIFAILMTNFNTGAQAKRSKTKSKDGIFSFHNKNRSSSSSSSHHGSSSSSSHHSSSSSSPHHGSSSTSSHHGSSSSSSSSSKHESYKSPTTTHHDKSSHDAKDKTSTKESSSDLHHHTTHKPLLHSKDTKNHTSSWVGSSSIISKHNDNHKLSEHNKSHKDVNHNGILSNKPHHGYKPSAPPLPSDLSSITKTKSHVLDASPQKHKNSTMGWQVAVAHGNTDKSMPLKHESSGNVKHNSTIDQFLKHEQTYLHQNPGHNKIPHESKSNRTSHMLWSTPTHAQAKEHHSYEPSAPPMEPSKSHPPYPSGDHAASHYQQSGSTHGYYPQQAPASHPLGSDAQYHQSATLFGNHPQYIPSSMPGIPYNHPHQNFPVPIPIVVHQQPRESSFSEEFAKEFAYALRRQRNRQRQHGTTTENPAVVKVVNANQQGNVQQPLPNVNPNIQIYPNGQVICQKIKVNATDPKNPMNIVEMDKEQCYPVYAENNPPQYPQNYPNGQIACHKIRVNETDPKNRSTVIEVEKEECYPVYPENYPPQYPQNYPNEQIACHKIRVNETDPKNSSKAIEVEKEECYPVYPQNYPSAQITCHKIKVNETDPDNSSKTIEVEREQCYPFYPPQYPQTYPNGQIVCNKIKVNETDPNNSTRTIEVEKEQCYPAYPPNDVSQGSQSAGNPGQVICYKTKVFEVDPNNSTNIVEVIKDVCRNPLNFEMNAALVQPETYNPPPPSLNQYPNPNYLSNHQIPNNKSTDGGLNSSFNTQGAIDPVGGSGSCAQFNIKLFASLSFIMLLYFT
uniref:Uncharacterized protein n=1 Tax=Musca domestica TaxID=7370 RepID=A0A1I8MGK8_MUSDO